MEITIEQKYNKNHKCSKCSERATSWKNAIGFCNKHSRSKVNPKYVNLNKAEDTSADELNKKETKNNGR